MWTDEVGSEVLGVLECRRLLAAGVSSHRHGHVGVAEDDGPIVLPVNYAMHGPDVVLQVGERMFARLSSQHVGFLVDGITTTGPGDDGAVTGRWSVLVRGLAIEETRVGVDNHVPRPEVMWPGERIVRIRADVVTGRRFALVPGVDGHVTTPVV